MPIPKPNPNEKEEEFISRCMATKEMQEYDQKQRAAICYSSWRESKKGSKKEFNDFNVFAPVTKVWKDENAKDALGKELRFFEATVSGLKEDRDNEMISKEAIEDMIAQFKSGSIPFFPNHGRNKINGERTYDWKDIMGVWVDARLEGDKLKAVCRLNNANPEADEFYNYMLAGMPLGFSIGGKPISASYVEIDDETKVEIDKNQEEKK